MYSTLSEAHFERMDAEAKELRTRAAAQAVFLTDRGGNILARQAERELAVEDNLLALSAGSFFASQQVAMMLGEPAFESLTERGRAVSVHMRALAGEHLLLVIFGPDTNLGLVKLGAEDAVRRLQDTLTEPSGGAAPAFEIDFSREVFLRR